VFHSAIPLRLVCSLFILAIGIGSVSAAESPLVTVDLNVGESATVQLPDGTEATVKLLGVDEQRDGIRDAVRKAVVTVEVNGHNQELVSGNYRLPVRVGGVQIDSPVTGGYNSNGTKESWGLDKDARLRLWPEQGPWIDPVTFGYPIRQRWFASATQMSNEPTYVDGGEPASRRKIYYHSGLDIGGCEGLTEVIAATDGLVVSVGQAVLDEYRRDTPVAARYDVVYIRDARGWFYRYSHLHTIDPAVVPGRVIARGDRIGLLGKEGASGGWSHLHFEIKSRQPSGQWGTQEGYAFLWDAYQREHQPQLLAVARPHYLLRAGETIELDGSRSWSAAGDITAFRWTLSDGSTATGPRIAKRYDRAGSFSEILEVRDAAGKIAHDFCIVQVHDPQHPDVTPPTIHPAYFPTQGIKPSQPVTFKVRTFGTQDGEEQWDFGDGTPAVRVRSDGNVKALAKDGYAITTHAFEKPGQYLVRVERVGAAYPTIGHLCVTVEE
jgi:hypothetical protein